MDYAMKNINNAVALLAEGVGRNLSSGSSGYQNVVALLAEGVGRNRCRPLDAHLF